jgi:hypothetical protein
VEAVGRERKGAVPDTRVAEDPDRKYVPLF